MKHSLETLVTGCALIEGPRVDESGSLYFSDVHRGGVYRRAPDGEVETVVPKRRGVGGLALHADGGVVVSGRNLCHVRDGHSRILYEDAEVLGFNDLQPDQAGRLYVGEIRYRIFEDEGVVPGALLRLEAGGRCTALYGGIKLSNGIGFSPDETRLYHSDTRRGEILVSRRSEDGEWAAPRSFARPPRGRPDGLAVDAEGHVWTACFGGGCVSRFAPDGRLERHLEVPAREVTSLVFGGSDRRDLYITTADHAEDPSLGGSVFRTRVDVPGQATPLVRV